MLDNVHRCGETLVCRTICTCWKQQYEYKSTEEVNLYLLYVHVERVRKEEKTKAYLVYSHAFFEKMGSFYRQFFSFFLSFFCFLCVCAFFFCLSPPPPPPSPLLMFLFICLVTKSGCALHMIWAVCLFLLLLFTEPVVWLWDSWTESVSLRARRTVKTDCTSCLLKVGYIPLSEARLHSLIGRLVTSLCLRLCYIPSWGLVTSICLRLCYIPSYEGWLHPFEALLHSVLGGLVTSLWGSVTCHHMRVGYIPLSEALLHSVMRVGYIP